MKCLIILLLFGFHEFVRCDPGFLFDTARIQASTENKRRISILQNVEYINGSLFPETQLKISSKGMSVLFEGCFRNMENLKILLIPECNINRIKPGAFVDLPNLEKIHLEDNIITKIENGVFSTMNISHLFLHRNKISYIDSEAFDNMPNLYLIKLNANQIKSWNNNWFYNTPKLTEIFIRRNYISNLGENAFKNIKKLQVGHTEDGNATNIYLSNNKISTIHPHALSDIITLNNFYLDRNNITDIPQKLFAEVESIIYLNLKRNKIKKIPNDMFPRIHHFRTLDLANNDLECIPTQLTTQISYILLKDNFISCECKEDLSAYHGRGIVKNSTLDIGECERDHQENDDEDDEIDDEEEINEEGI